MRVPALPEIVTEGDSVEEAIFMAQDALELVVLSRLEEREVVPVNKKLVKLGKKDILKDTFAGIN